MTLWTRKGGLRFGATFPNGAFKQDGEDRKKVATKKTKKEMDGVFEEERGRRDWGAKYRGVDVRERPD